MNNRKHAEMKPSSWAWQFPEEGKGLNSKYDHTGHMLYMLYNLGVLSWLENFNPRD